MLYFMTLTVIVSSVIEVITDKQVMFLTTLKVRGVLVWCIENDLDLTSASTA